jgi:hypothetical protein
MIDISKFGLLAVVLLLNPVGIILIQEIMLIGLTGFPQSLFALAVLAFLYCLVRASPRRHQGAAIEAE